MNKTVPFDIVGGYGKSEFSEFNAQEAINEYAALDSLGERAMFPRAGVSKEKAIATNGYGRRFHSFDGSVYSVVGPTIYKIDSLLNVSFIGNIGTNTGHVGIANNQTQVMFVDGSGEWILDTSTNVFGAITSPNFLGNAIDVTCVGGRFIVARRDTNVMQYSSIEDGTTWDATDTIKLGPYADTMAAIRSYEGRFYALGNLSLQSWYVDSGAEPFLPDNPSLQVGCAAIGSVVSELGYLMWLSKNSNGTSSVMLGQGTSSGPISSSAFENAVEKYTDVSDATAYIYKNELGHIFYVINFTIDNATWQYQINSKLPIDDRWSKIDYQLLNRGLAEDHIFFNGKHYTMGYNDFNLYELSVSYNDDAGVNIRRRRTCKEIKLPTGERFSLNMFKLIAKKGTGSVNSEDLDPTILLSVSYDRGYSFSNIVRASLGKVGQTMYETRWDRLGNSDSFVVRLEHYNKTKLFLKQAILNVTGGA